MALSQNQPGPGHPTSLSVTPRGLQSFWLTLCTTFVLLSALGRNLWAHIPAEKHQGWMLP